MTKWSRVTRYSEDLYPRALRFTALKTLFNPSMKAVLSSFSQCARIPFRWLLIVFTDLASGASKVPQRSHFASAQFTHASSRIRAFSWLRVINGSKTV